MRPFLNNKGFIKYFNNTSWLFAEKILRMMISLFIGIWIARYLGPSDFGLFSYVQSFVGLFIVFSTLGLDSIIIKELVKNEAKCNELIGTAFYLKLIGSIIIIIIISFIIPFISTDNYTNILIYIISLSIIFQSFNVVDFYFQSKILSKYVVYINTISLFISSSIKIILILNEASLISFTYVILFDSIILAFGFIYIYIKENSLINIKSLHFDKKLAISLLKDSWPLILSGFVISIYMKIDQVMIKEILTVKEVGEYAVAARISELWYFFPMILVSSLFPAIINAKKNNDALYYSRLQKLYNLMLWSSIIIAIIITFLSETIILFLFGNVFINASDVLVIHIWTGIFIFFNIACSKWVIIENLQKYAIYLDISAVGINIILNIIFIPIWGIKGAAFATLLSYSTSIFLVYSIIPQFRIVIKMFLKSLVLPLDIIYNLIKRT